PDLGAAPLAAERVDLVEEDDAGRVLLRVLEEVADPGRADADKHLDEVRAAEREVGHFGLARDGAREQGLAGTGWSDQQDPARHPRAQLAETGGRLEKLYDFLQLALGLVHAHHAIEGDLLSVTDPRL